MTCIRCGCLYKVEKGDSSVASFIVSVEEHISERECKLIKSLNNTVKLALYIEPLARRIQEGFAWGE